MRTGDELASLPLAELRPIMTARLSGLVRRAVDDEEADRRAAVAIAVYEKGGSTHFLMIKRAHRHSNPGQWALPGGRMDVGETIAGTAIRELCEETGLAAGPDDVVGLLDDFTSSRGIVITPVVIVLCGVQSPRRSPNEVASLHPLPLTRLTAPGVPRWKRSSGSAALLQLPLRHDMLVHAPTGAILWQFAEVALQGRPTRVADVAEPGFTAR